MDDLHLMNVFVAVAGGAGFAGAARQLGLSPAAVTRAMHTLEGRLGVALFVRDGNRRPTLSDAGRRYLDDASAILHLVSQAEQAATSANTLARGTLRVTAPVVFGRLYIVPAIADYLRRHPGMDVAATLVDRNVNLVDEGFDVAVRIGPLPDSGMKALKLGQVVRGAYAAPAYLHQHGTPRHPQDLQQHRCIATDVAATQVAWRFGPRGAATTVRLKPALAVTSADAAIHAAVLGAGVVCLPDYQVRDELARGALVPVLDGHTGEGLPVHLLHRESRYGSARVRHFIDLLAERLRAGRTPRAATVPVP